MRALRSILGLGLSAVLLAGCRREVDPADYGGFPEDIGEILVTNCATSGCHDDASHAVEGRLSLSGWDEMFEGSRAGAAVIPYRADLSFMLYFINTDTALGIAQTPTMPLNLPPLPREDYLKIRDWVNAGAPSTSGEVKWSDNPGRAKIYVVNQGCDQVAVMDRDTRLVMRYVDVGQIPGVTELPHNVKVSPDGKWWYLVFIGANPSIERYDAGTDAFAGRASLSQGNRNTIDISPDGRYAASPDLVSGKAVIVDLATMQLAAEFNIGGDPHGTRFAPGGEALYFTQQEGSELTKLVYTDLLNPSGIETVDLEQHIPRSQPLRAMGPHEMLYTPDGSRYIVTCQYQDEVRFYQASNDSLLAVVHTGSFPSEIDVSADHGYAFVSCMEDTTLFPGNPLRRGSVAVIDLQDFQLVASVYTGFQPHGMAVDEEKGLVYVANRNAKADGPAPHHSSVCGGRNGNITAIQMSTLTLVPNFKHELSTDPYSVAFRK